MILQEIIDTIINSDTAEWNCIACWGHGTGPSYKDHFQFWNTYNSNQNVVTVRSHSDVCIYKPDISISIAYGLRFYGEEDDNDEGIAEDWAINNPNPNPGRPCYADIFYNNGLVHRVSYCVVDGGRCKLPFPHRSDSGNWIVERQYSDFIEKLNELSDTHNYDEYLGRSGIITTDEAWV